MIDYWRSLVGETPHRQDVRDRFVALPALPEAGRMRSTVIHETADDATVRIPRRTKVQRLVDAYNQKHGMKVSA